MVKGHVEIHDLLANHTDSDPKASSDASSMEDTVELRVMMAYAQRRRPKNKPDRTQTETETENDRPAVVSGDVKETETPPEEKTPEKKKKKKKKRGLKLLKFFRCVNPQTEDKEPPNDDEAPKNNGEKEPVVTTRCFIPEDEDVKEEEEEEKMSDVASRLTEIADEIPFAPPEWETDAPEGDENIEKMIGLLLRESGDRLHEKELADANIALELFWNYSFFRSLINSLLKKMGLRSPDPESPGPKASPKTQIAVTCEITSRLSRINTLPSQRLLTHGAKYLQDYFSGWVDEQGGYEVAFKGDEDEVE